ncbi:MAG: SGNH/GDSL hydrolase family protein [Vicinamibacteria bacterium]|nr:SGNH/GDSL hydrolase family protein [Vicinamibacteria bacterium]
MSRSPISSSSSRRESRAREWLLRLALVTLSLIFVLGTAEAVARLLRSRQHGGKEGGEDARYNEYDPLLGWRKKGNAAATYQRREYTVEVRTNSRGLRDPERPIDPSHGVFRVLALGDSFVEGYTVDFPETVTQRIERRLDEAGCNAEVINGATAAYSTDQEYLFYQSEGARYRPALVLLFFYWNDVLYSDRQDYFGTPKPAFEMGGGALKLHRYPVKEKPKDVAAPAVDEVPETFQGSALLEMVRERLWLGAPDLHDAVARLGLWNPIPKVSPRLEMLVYDHRDLAPIEDAWEKVGAIVAALRNDVHAHGSTLALVYIPGRMEIQQASWKVTRQLYQLKEGDWNLGKVRDKIQHLGAALEVAVIDLTPALKAADQIFKPTYFTFDGHWNARGHDVAAGAVFDWMKGAKALPSICGGTLPLTAASGAVQAPPWGESR